MMDGGNVCVFGLFVSLSLSFVENGRLLVAARSVRGPKHQETLLRDLRGREPESTSLTVKVTEHLNFLCTVCMYTYCTLASTVRTVLPITRGFLSKFVKQFPSDRLRCLVCAALDLSQVIP